MGRLAGWQVGRVESEVGGQSKNAIIFQRRRRQRLNVTFKHDVVIF